MNDKYFSRRVPNRREFLAASAASGTSAWLLAKNTALANDLDGSKKLGVALVGLGGFATTTVAPEIASCKHVRLAGVVTGDPDGKGKEWAKQYGFDPQSIYTYDTMEEMQNNPSIDFVHVITPNGLHAAHTIRAAEAGKHVLCEKPMAVSASQCQNMIDACQRAGVKLGIDYRLHFEPHHQEMMRLASSEVFGKLRDLTTAFSWNRGDNKPWLLDKSLAGGGAFFDTGVYCVQAGCYMTNETPQSVSAVGSSTRSVYPAGIEETMAATFEYPSGVVMQSLASYTNSHHAFVACCEKGTFACEGPVDKHGNTFGQSARGEPNGKSISLPNGKRYKAQDTLQLAQLLDAFAESIMNKAPFGTPGEMGLRDIRIIEAVYRSAALDGQQVTVEV